MSREYPSEIKAALLVAYAASLEKLTIEVHEDRFCTLVVFPEKETKLDILKLVTSLSSYWVSILNVSENGTSLRLQPRADQEEGLDPWCLQLRHGPKLVPQPKKTYWDKLLMGE
jgi:hypothetical protein